MSIAVAYLDRHSWLEALLDCGNRCELTMCRNDHRGNDWRIPGRSLDEHLIVLVEHGHLEIQIAEDRFRLGPGALVWIPPNTFRELRGADDAQMLWHYKLRFRLLDSHGCHLSFSKNYFHLQDGIDIIPYFRPLIEEHRHHTKYHNLRLRALLTSFATEFFRIERRSDGDNALGLAQRERLDRLVTQHLKRGLTPADMAGELGLTLDYFSRLFRQTYGISPRGYIIRERIRAAADLLLESKMTVKQLALDFGFHNVSYFCRQFRKIMGQSPAKYRETNHRQTMGQVLLPRKSAKPISPFR